MYFNVKARAKNSHHREIKGAVLFLVSLLLAYFLVVPAHSGMFGRAVAKLFFLTFGGAAYLVPAILAWWGWVSVNRPLPVHWRLDVVLAVLLLMVGASFLSLAGSLNGINYGGWVGLKLSPFFRRLFETSLSLVISAGLFVYIASLILRVSLKNLALVVWRRLAEDIREWEKVRSEVKKSAAPRIRTPGPAAAGPVPGSKPEAPAAPTIVVPQKTMPKAAPVSRREAADPGRGAAGQKTPAPERTAPPAVPYKLPPLDFLSSDQGATTAVRPEEHLANAELLTRTLADFDIQAKVNEIIPGPVVTRYDIELAPGIKIQSVVALSDNIALAMKSPSIRVVPVPEKSAVGVEVPNTKSCIVGLKGILSSPEFQHSPSLLTLALGKTTNGTAYATDLMPMPHLLIAGATGSGKSVCIHSLILSILYRARPDEVKFLLIDPKRLEMPIYRGLPHLYDPRVPADRADIVTNPKEAAESLKKLVRVMEKRYEKFARETVRNIEGYNEKMAQTGGEREFYIVVIIDELADLMLIATKDVEDSIQRLAQMARAVGIHLVLATQRPSVDVITGVIKANFPARIAFQTTSKVDSRVILDAIGADALLGKGDMLFLPPGESKPIRLQGAFVSVKEAENAVNFIRQQNIPPHYEYQFAASAESGGGAEDGDESGEELSQALRLVLERKRVSQDLLKAHFGSSARATNLLSLLETRGFIHKPEGTNRWTIHFDKIADYLGSPPQGQ